MEYAIPSLIAACGFLFVVWQRAVGDSKKALAREEASRVREHTSDIMKRATAIRHSKLIDLDKKRDRRKRELGVMAESIARASGPAEVATIWNQEQ
jgi:hypothetical protein